MHGVNLLFDTTVFFFTIRIQHEKNQFFLIYKRIVDDEVQQQQQKLYAISICVAYGKNALSNIEIWFNSPPMLTNQNKRAKKRKQNDPINAIFRTIVYKNHHTLQINERYDTVRMYDVSQCGSNKQK